MGHSAIVNVQINDYITVTIKVHRCGLPSQLGLNLCKFLDKLTVCDGGCLLTKVLDHLEAQYFDVRVDDTLEGETEYRVSVQNNKILFKCDLEPITSPAEFIASFES